MPKTYKSCRRSDGIGEVLVVAVEDNQERQYYLPLSRKRAGGHGNKTVALAILTDYTHNYRKASNAFVAFARIVIAEFPEGDWSITSEEIDTFLDMLEKPLPVERTTPVKAALETAAGVAR